MTLHPKLNTSWHLQKLLGVIIIFHVDIASSIMNNDIISCFLHFFDHHRSFRLLIELLLLVRKCMLECYIVSSLMFKSIPGDAAKLHHSPHIQLEMSKKIFESINNLLLLSAYES